jgi:flagellar motor component MotA
MLEGVISIVEGMNPKLIRVKLEAFLPDKGAAKKVKAGSSAAEASQAVPAG